LQFSFGSVSLSLRREAAQAAAETGRALVSGAGCP
jgi:hypothetical protein